MNPIPKLAPFLKQLRLSGILDSLEARNLQAIDSKLAYTASQHNAAFCVTAPYAADAAILRRRR